MSSFLADFEKAFDTVKWDFLKTSLKYFGFGPHFCKWISTLYQDIESCVTNNGYLSSYFKLQKGIRQGCPISALLFLLIAEIVATILRQTGSVKGLNINGTSLKLCQLADDMTLFLTDISSVKATVQIFEEFYRYAGLKLNKQKTVVFIVNSNSAHMKDESIGVQWTNKPFKTLGTWFSSNPDETARLNTTSKLNHIKAILRSWQSRQLSLKGKIIVIKSLLVPHILQLASVTVLSDKVISNFESLLCNFVWSNRKHLVAKSTLIQLPEAGGLKMPSVKHIVNSVKILWVKRLYNNCEAKWKILTEFLMGIDRKHLLQEHFFESVKPKIVTKFYSNLLSVWYDFIKIDIKSVSEFLTLKLFNNPAITINNKPVSPESDNWTKSGFENVADLFNETQMSFKTKQEVQNCFNIVISDLKFNQIVSVLSFILRRLSKNKKSANIIHPKNVKLFQGLESFKKITTAKVYQYLISKISVIPNSQNKWIEFYPFLESATWENIYLLPSKIVIDTYLITMQFKILHRVFSCNYKLFLWNIKTSPKCDACQKVDNLEHYFYYCSDVEHFWRQVENWLSNIIASKVKLTVLEVLLGFLNFDSKFYYSINYVIIIAKFYLNKAKKMENKYFSCTFCTPLGIN